MLNLRVGQEIILYFNGKEHKTIIIGIEFGEIVWVEFRDENEKQEYYHIHELIDMMKPENINQQIDTIEEYSYNFLF